MGEDWLKWPRGVCGRMYLRWTIFVGVSARGNAGPKLQCLCDRNPAIYKLPPSIFMSPSFVSSIMRSRGHLAQHAYTQYHDEQTDRHDDEQGETKPAHDHGTGADTGPDRAVSEILRDDGGGYRCGVLPQNRDEDENGGDEDDGESNLGDGAGGEGLDVALRTFAVLLFVPSGEGREEDEANEGEDDGDDAVPGQLL